MYKRKNLITEDGREVPLMSISLIEMEMAQEGLTKEYKDRGEPIDPPTYTYELYGGGTETRVHDETTLHLKPEDITTTTDPEEQARLAQEQTEKNLKAWAAYKDARARLDFEMNEMRTEFMLDGVDVQLPEDNTWELRQRKRHVAIPEDPIDKLNHYKKTVVLRTPMDIMNATQEIMILSSSGTVSEGELRAASANFLRPLQEKSQQLQRDWNTPEPVEDQTGPLETHGAAK